MDWYKEDVQAAIRERINCRHKPETIFYGSSTIRLWSTLYEDFKEYKPVNLGFGGSTLAACAWFFESIVAPVPNPQRFIFYAGDNDLGDGRHPEEVFLFYCQFIVTLRKYFSVPLYFISIKPSISRRNIGEKIRYTNRLIKEEIEKNGLNEFFVDVYEKMISRKGLPLKTIFETDGLHLNKEGYKIWKEIINKEVFKK